MRANVYALMEQRGGSFDFYMVTATEQEALDHYRQVTGRPGNVSLRSDNDGHAVVILDKDDSGQAVISQYKVGIEEIIDS